MSEVARAKERPELLTGGGGEIRLTIEKLVARSSVVLDEVNSWLTRLEDPSAGPVSVVPDVQALNADALQAAIADPTGSFNYPELERVWANNSIFTESGGAGHAETRIGGNLALIREALFSLDVANALTLIGTAFETDGSDVRILLTAGVANLAYGYVDASIANFERAVEVAPDDELRAEALFFTGQSKVLGGRPVDGLEDFQKAADLETEIDSRWALIRGVQGRSHYHYAHTAGLVAKTQQLTSDQQRQARWALSKVLTNNGRLMAPAFASPQIGAIESMRDLVREHVERVSVDARLFANGGEAYLREIRDIIGMGREDLRQFRRSLSLETYLARRNVPETVLSTILRHRFEIVKREQTVVDQLAEERRSAVEKAESELNRQLKKLEAKVRDEELQAAALDEEAETVRRAITKTPRAGTHVPRRVFEIRDEYRRKKKIAVLSFSFAVVGTGVLSFLLFKSVILTPVLMAVVGMGSLVGLAIWTEKPKQEIKPFIGNLADAATKLRSRSERLRTEVQQKVKAEHQVSVNDIETRFQNHMEAVLREHETVRIANTKFFRSVERTDWPDAMMPTLTLPADGADVGEPSTIRIEAAQVGG